MPVADFAQGVTSASYWMSHLDRLPPKHGAAVANTASTTTAKTQTASSSGDGKSFFDDLLDIVNPLQHLPIVGTIYRAVTGDKIGDVEKVAGDTLYGGPIGLVSSLADLAFEKITGKNFGDTMLAMVGIGDKDTAIASNALASGGAQTKTAMTVALNKGSLITPPATQIAQTATAAPARISPLVASTAPPAQTIVDISPQTDALLASLQKNGITGAMQTQALDAYRRTMTMTAQPATLH